jgi:hypothetical protein
VLLRHTVYVRRWLRACDAYLADVFGTQFVGAIHGRLLTAWSTAGIIGPVVVNYLREFQLVAGVPRDHLYNSALLCRMFGIGLLCNLLVRPVNPKRVMSAKEVRAADQGSGSQESDSYGIGKGGFRIGRRRAVAANQKISRAFLRVNHTPQAIGMQNDGAKSRGGSSRLCLKFPLDCR